jgi:excisionase family DNA binding protein
MTTTTTTTTADANAPRMYTRSDAMRILRIGETSIYWLTKTGKLRSVRIGARVLIPATEVECLCRKGTTLTEAEKSAARGDREPRRRGRPRKRVLRRPEASE